MAHIAQAGGGHVEHDGGGGVAHVAHVGGAGTVGGLLGVEGMDDPIQGLFQGGVQLFRLEVVAKLFPDAHHGGAGIGAEELRRQPVVRLSPLRSTQLPHALIHHGPQRAVGDVVGEGHGDLILHLGTGH